MYFSPWISALYKCPTKSRTPSTLQRHHITCKFSRCAGPDHEALSTVRRPFLCRYVVRNSTNLGLVLGQAETHEGRTLQPGRALSYCWRSHKKPPLLRICRDTGRYKWSKPFSIDDVGSFVRISSIPFSGQYIHHLQTYLAIYIFGIIIFL